MMLLQLKTIWSLFPLLPNLVSFLSYKMSYKMPDQILCPFFHLGSSWFLLIWNSSLCIVPWYSWDSPPNVMWLWVQSKVTFIEQKFLTLMWSNSFFALLFVLFWLISVLPIPEPSSINYISLSFTSKSLFLTSVCCVWYRSKFLSLYIEIFPLWRVSVLRLSLLICGSTLT